MIHDQEHMEAWIIDEANKFIQSFKQMTYIQDRRIYLENRNDGFYYFEMINSFETQIAKLRLIFVQSYNCLRKLYMECQNLYIWKRVIQRLNDIMEVSKMQFPFYITDEFFVQNNILNDVVNFLGKRQEDQGMDPMQMIKRANQMKKSRKSLFSRNPNSQDNEIQKETQPVRTSQFQLFLQSNIKYLQTFKNLGNIYSSSMEIEPPDQFNFNFDKPLSYNLQGIYQQMLARNQSIQKTIHEYLASKQARQVFRKQQIKNDLAQLSQLQARLLSEHSSRNTERENTFDPVNQIQQKKIKSRSSNTLKIPSTLTSKYLSSRASQSNEARLARKNSQLFLLNQALADIQNCRESKLKKMQQSATSMIKPAEYDPTAPIDNKRKSQSYYKPRISRSKFFQKNAQIKFKSNEGKQHFERQQGIGIRIVIRKSRNLHLLNTKNLLSYKEFIQKRIL